MIEHAITALLLVVAVFILCTHRWPAVMGVTKSLRRGGFRGAGLKVLE